MVVENLMLGSNSSYTVPPSFFLHEGECVTCIMRLCLDQGQYHPTEAIWSTMIMRNSNPEMGHLLFVLECLKSLCMFSTLVCNMRYFSAFEWIMPSISLVINPCPSAWSLMRYLPLCIACPQMLAVNVTALVWNVYMSYQSHKVVAA